MTSKKLEQYEFKINNIGIEFLVKNNTDGTQSWIPKDESNSDYQRYLRWLEDPTAEEGGTLS